MDYVKCFCSSCLHNIRAIQKCGYEDIMAVYIDVEGMCSRKKTK
jgi:hypothetical protein